ncbi:MAG TPA: amidohydrolase, partial [Desulfatirhabdiaceae bacterium]|nr:amidohydrolase [Desulfatirhabdiaceae bacterium]
LIIENATILTMDASLTIIENGMICVDGDTIVHVGPGSKSAPEFQAKKTIDAKNGLVLPGLINGHTHAAMTLFRGLADDLPLMDWLNHYIFPVESKMDAEFVYQGARLACAEMILSGTTTFCDMYLFENETAKAASQSGMRALVGEVLYDFTSPNYGPIERGFEYTQYLIDTWQGHPLISIAVEPHALYTCSPDLLKQANAIAVRNSVPMAIHVAETLSELETIQTRYGKKPFEHMESLGILGPHIVADHCVYLDDSEIDRIMDHGVRVITDPESNMKLASGVPRVPDLLDKGIVVGLGTDGCASNNNLDMLSEMDSLAKLHKVHRMDPTVMDAVTVVKCATIEGARALGLSDRIGSIETGKKADLIIVDMNKPHLTPMYNPYSHLVYAANGADVSHSLINGKLVMENRRLLTMDLAEIMASACEQAERVKKWTRNH